MKKLYRKPEVEIEGFVPNEYVAVCSWVQLPGSDEWVEAIDIQANRYYTDYGSSSIDPDTKWPIYNGTDYDVFNGSFKVKLKDENGKEYIKEYVTADGYNGDPSQPNINGILGDHCMQGKQGLV